MQEAKLSLQRFRTVLFGASATVRDPAVSGGSPCGEAEAQAAAASTGHGVPATSTRGCHRPGQGRQGTEAYAGAERVACHHEALRIGKVCPACGRGWLYAVQPGVERRLTGTSCCWLSVMRWSSCAARRVGRKTLRLPRCLRRGGMRAFGGGLNAPCQRQVVGVQWRYGPAPHPPCRLRYAVPLGLVTQLPT